MADRKNTPNTRPRLAIVIGTLTLAFSFLVHSFMILDQIQTMKRLEIGRKDFPTDVPRLNLTLHPATMTVILSDQYSLKADEEWEALTPIGDGFIRDTGGNRSFYLFSMYHQIHCLNVFRRSLAYPHNLTSLELGHVDHCLRYMQQITLCHADDTLEPTHPFQMPSGKWTNVVTGINVTHECKDWVQLRDYAEENFGTWLTE
ncbi:hypothetical protein F5146DRAFT_1143176 [Armillaria mellea]|nr:hypothetical protein F5146DRAFT_1143176 [Armillaria mellea]